MNFYSHNDYFYDEFFNLDHVYENDIENEYEEEDDEEEMNENRENENEVSDDYLNKFLVHITDKVLKNRDYIDYLQDESLRVLENEIIIDNDSGYESSENF